MFNRGIERKAEWLLERVGCEAPPIDVRSLAESIGIVVRPMKGKDRVSGLLVLKDGKATIGYNEEDAEVRQRFTIAHEIGHYVMHKDSIKLFIDEGYRVAYRDDRSSTGEIRREREANAFAAALLMPRNLVTDKVESLRFDLGDDEALRELASDFGVSTQAMAYRLSNLDIFSGHASRM
jgi:Zn-dependent peptidase ImmA (M78 family)